MEQSFCGKYVGGGDVMELRIPGRVERELKKLLDISFSSYANPREIEFRLGMIMSDPRFYSEALKNYRVFDTAMIIRSRIEMMKHEECMHERFIRQKRFSLTTGSLAL